MKKKLQVSLVSILLLPLLAFIFLAAYSIPEEVNYLQNIICTLPKEDKSNVDKVINSIHEMVIIDNNKKNDAYDFLGFKNHKIPYFISYGLVGRLLLEQYKDIYKSNPSHHKNIWKFRKVILSRALMSLTEEEIIRLFIYNHSCHNYNSLFEYIHHQTTTTIENLTTNETINFILLYSFGCNIKSLGYINLEKKYI